MASEAGGALEPLTSAPLSSTGMSYGPLGRRLPRKWPRLVRSSHSASEGRQNSSSFAALYGSNGTDNADFDKSKLRNSDPVRYSYYNLVRLEFGYGRQVLRSLLTMRAPHYAATEDRHRAWSSVTRACLSLAGALVLFLFE